MADEFADVPEGLLMKAARKSSLITGDELRERYTESIKALGRAEERAVIVAEVERLRDEHAATVEHVEFSLGVRFSHECHARAMNNVLEFLKSSARAQSSDDGGGK